MIKQDISIIEGVTFIQELKTRDESIGFYFSLSSNHPEKNLPFEFLEVFDVDKGWLKNKAVNPDGRIRIHIPADKTSNFSHLSGRKYSITAKSADGFTQVVANGFIKYKQPEDAEESDMLSFELTGASDNAIQKLVSIVDKKISEIKPEEVKAPESKEVKHNNKPLDQFLAESNKKFNQSLSDLNSSQLKSISELKLNIYKEISSLHKDKTNKDEIILLEEKLTKTIDCFAKYNSDILRLFKGETSLSIQKNGDISVGGIKIKGDYLKAKDIEVDSVKLLNKNINDCFAKPNGDKDKDFYAKNLIVDGVDLYYLKTLEQRLQAMSRRISELEGK